MAEFSELAPFQYEPLPTGSTRIVFVQPGSPADPLWCVVSQAETSLPKRAAELIYFGFSYTWGDSSKVRRLRVTNQGENDNQFLVVTQSLITALEHIRDAFVSIPIWCDQISIDQTNQTEKVAQIALMKDLYEQARGTIVWLGPEADDSDIVLHFMTTRTWNRETFEDLLLASGRPRFACPSGEAILDHGGTKRIFTALTKLLERPYWQRLWIMQESTACNAAKTLVFCGRLNARLSVFFNLAYVIQGFAVEYAATGSVIHDLAAKTGVLTRLISFSKNRETMTRPILSVLEMARSRGATDPRDYLFAMLGLASDVSPPTVWTPGTRARTFNIDYSAALHEVYADFAIWYIGTKQSLDILAHCDIGSQQWSTEIQSMHKEGRITTQVGAQAPETVLPTPSQSAIQLPSWVPDWRYSIAHRILPKHQIVGDLSSSRLFSASCPGPPPQTSLIVPQHGRRQISVLINHGLRVTSIHKVSDKPCTQTTDADAETTWQPSKPEEACPLTGLCKLGVFRRTLYCDLKLAEVGDGILTARRVHSEYECPWYATPERDAQGRRRNFAVFSRLKSTTLGRNMFYTSSSEETCLFGLGPSQAKAGDEIWILIGASVPLILRPILLSTEITKRALDLSPRWRGVRDITYQAREVVYHVVGECFLLGIMDGEVLDMLGQNPKRPPPACLAGMDQEWRDGNIF